MPLLMQELHWEVVVHVVHSHSHAQQHQQAVLYVLSKQLVQH